MFCYVCLIKTPTNITLSHSTVHTCGGALNLQLTCTVHQTMRPLLLTTMMVIGDARDTPIFIATFSANGKYFFDSNNNKKSNKSPHKHSRPGPATASFLCHFRWSTSFFAGIFKRLCIFFSIARQFSGLKDSAIIEFFDAPIFKGYSVWNSSANHSSYGLF